MRGNHAGSRAFRERWGLIAFFCYAKEDAGETVISHIIYLAGGGKKEGDLGRGREEGGLRMRSVVVGLESHAACSSDGIRIKM